MLLYESLLNEFNEHKNNNNIKLSNESLFELFYYFEKYTMHHNYSKRKRMLLSSIMKYDIKIEIKNQSVDNTSEEILLFMGNMDMKFLLLKNKIDDDEIISRTEKLIDKYKINLSYENISELLLRESLIRKCTNTLELFKLKYDLNERIRNSYIEKLQNTKELELNIKRFKEFLSEIKSSWLIPF